MRKKRRMIIIISIIALILIISSIILTIFLIKNNKEESKNKINLEELENNFSTIFTNTVHPDTDGNKEKIYLVYDAETTKTGSYKIDINIPKLGIDTDVADEINNDIFNSFVKTIAQIMGQDGPYIVYNVDYVSYINNNILSVVIRCTLKEGSNPQKLIIRTYNYDMENDKILTLPEIINLKNLNQEEIQNKIWEKINNEIKKVSAIQDSGYNVYKRDINNTIYKIENTTEFFLGEGNALYLLYPYGNTDYTSELDLIICE